MEEKKEKPKSITSQFRAQPKRRDTKRQQKELETMDEKVSTKMTRRSLRSKEAQPNLDGKLLTPDHKIPAISSVVQLIFHTNIPDDYYLLQYHTFIVMNGRSYEYFISYNTTAFSMHLGKSRMKYKVVGNNYLYYSNRLYLSHMFLIFSYPISDNVRNF